MRPPSPLGPPIPYALRPVPQRRSLSLALVLLLGAVVLAIVLYVAQFSGFLRWFLVLVFLGVLAALAWRRIRAGSSELAPLVRTAQPDSAQPGRLGSLSASVHRAAARNLAYSQLVVTSRARSAFLERMGLALALSPESVRQVQGDRDALLQILGDRELADFLSVRSGGLEEGLPWVRRARDGPGFGREFRSLIGRMEAWR